MKKTIFFIILALFSINSFAQKFGYIDSEFITSKMPEYKRAEEEMQKYSEKWIQDIQAKDAELKKMRLQFQQEEILMTPEIKRDRQKAIDDKESEIGELNNKIFGMNGLLFQKRKELMKGVMDNVYKACEKVARQKGLMFIFDKASDLSMIYTDPRHDYSDFVMEALGISLKEDKTEKK